MRIARALCRCQSAAEEYKDHGGGRRRQQPLLVRYAPRGKFAHVPCRAATPSAPCSSLCIFAFISADHGSRLCPVTCVAQHLQALELTASSCSASHFAAWVLAVALIALFAAAALAGSRRHRDAATTSSPSPSLAPPTSPSPSTPPSFGAEGDCRALYIVERCPENQLM